MTELRDEIYVLLSVMSLGFTVPLGKRLSYLRQIHHLNRFKQEMQSIVRIETPIGVSTGFVWNSDQVHDHHLVVTNRHCVEHSLPLVEHSLPLVEHQTNHVVQFIEQNSIIQYPAKVIGVHPVHDVAVLRINQHVRKRSWIDFFKYLRRIEKEHQILPLKRCMMAGWINECYVIGFPNLTKRHNIANGLIKSSPVLPSNIVDSNGMITDKIDSVCSTHRLRPGFSGSPCIDSNGKVCGIAYKNNRDTILERITKISNTSYIIQMQVLEPAVNEILKSAKYIE